MSDVAVGLGALGFWLFLAAIVVAGIWNDTKRKESQQETLRRIVESGEDIDPAVIDRMMGRSDAVKTARDLQIAGFITSAAGAGLFVFGVFLGTFDTKAMAAMTGIGLMVVLIGGGLLYAAHWIRNRSLDV